MTHDTEWAPDGVFRVRMVSRGGVVVWTRDVPDARVRARFGLLHREVNRIVVEAWRDPVVDAASRLVADAPGDDQVGMVAPDYSAIERRIAASLCAKECT